MIRYLKEVAVYVVLGGIAAGGVYVARQNRALAEQNRVLARRAVEPRAGLFVPAYRAATLDGSTVVLGQLGQRQVLVFFNTTCPYCRASTPAWNAVAERLGDRPEITVYGIALDSTEAAKTYAAEHRLAFPVISQPDPRLVALYRVSSVPLILVLNEDGRMTYARLGALESAAAVDSVVTAAQARPPVAEKPGP